MKQAICDNCGAIDDVRFGEVPILPQGLVIRVREASGGPAFDADLEVCDACKHKILAKFPCLEKRLEELGS